MATECYELQEAMIVQRSFSVGTINKASEMEKAQQEKAFSEAIAAVDISDEELSARRDRLSALSLQLHEVSLQAADAMSVDGYLSEPASERYHAVVTQRMAISDQLSAEKNGLQIYCSLQ